MDTLIDSTLSAEFQELYLENKVWLSDVLFLEDEMRFFKNLLGQIRLESVERRNLPQLETVNADFNEIIARLKHLKAILELRRHQLEQLLRGNLVTIGIEMIEEDASIILEIKSLMSAEKLFKAQLFALAEKHKNDKKRLEAQRVLKVQRYPLF